MIAGGLDPIIPASLNKANARRYKASPSVTDLKIFPGRTHYTVIASKGWEQVADYALAWATKQAQPAGRLRMRPLRHAFV